MVPKLLVPAETAGGTSEDLVYDGPPRLLEKLKASGDVLAYSGKGACEKDRVLESQTCAGTDREVHGA